MNISEPRIRQAIQHATGTHDANLWDTNLTPESQYEERPFHAGSRFPQQEPSLLAIRAAHPSLETVLQHDSGEHPEKGGSIGRRRKGSFIGTLKGMYGKQKMPLATLDIRIKDAFARYAGLPYGIDKVNADFFRPDRPPHGTPPLASEPENLPVQRRRHRLILADMKVDNLLTDPDITFHTRSTVDLTTLAQIFPLQEGIGMDGKMNADLKLRCRLSTLKKQDWGRVKMQGKIRTDKLVLRHTQKEFRVHKQRYAGLCRQRMARRAC